jgi:soluble lytic murein transglycosylase
MTALVLAALLVASDPGAAPRPPFTAAEAAPLFPAGPLAQAVRDLAEGRADAAAAAFDASRLPAARYLASLALLQAGKAGEAAARLEGLEAALPDLADRIARLRAQALEQDGRPLEAIQALGSVGPGSLLRAESLLARARLLAAAGDRRSALESLRPLLSQAAPDDPSRPDQAAEALLLTAQLRAGPGEAFDPAAARQDLIQCWAGHPLAPAAPRCREALRAPPFPPGEPLPRGDVLRHAEALLEANRNRSAAAELEELLPTLAPGSADACRARLALGRAYRKERRYPKAIEVLAPALAACREAPGRQAALHALAASSAVAAPGDAVERYRQLAREYPDSPVADDALYFAADLLARAGRVAEARAALADLVDRYPRGNYRAEALFRSAWLAWRAGETGAALAALERAEREYQESDPYEFARAAYWRGRILAERRRKGDAAAARALWRTLVARYPADYYGLLARARLAEARGRAPRWTPPTGPGDDFRYDPGGLRGDPHFRAGLLLLRMGQDRPAAEELRAVDRALLAPAEPQGADPLLLVAELLHRAGDHRAAHNLVRAVARQVLRRGPSGPSLRLWRIAYPPAWRDEVERWAPGAGVPTDLLQAMMREESALDPAAVSAAGAVGLTQLMLPTAQAEARRLKLGRPLTAADLMDGPLSIRLGAAHLGGVLRRFGGSAPLAVAAYNAGEAAVRGWVRERGRLPLDEFVEEIPVQETRGYVKRVLRSYAAYRLLYGGPGEMPVVLAQRLPAADAAPPPARAKGPSRW